MRSQTAKVGAFHQLHADGCFVLPNPWDLGSAVALEGMGFEALATTSAGHGWALGHADGRVPRDEVLEHLRLVAAAVDVPVNADFAGGFADDPDEVAVNVKLAVATGLAGPRTPLARSWPPASRPNPARGRRRAVRPPGRCCRSRRPA